MKILLFHQYYLEEEDPGGRRWNAMTGIWKKAGHELTVIAGMVHAHASQKRPEYRGRYHLCKIQRGITVHRTHVSETYNKNFAGRLWAYFSFVVSSLWAALFKVRGDFDLIIVTSPPLFVGISALLVSVLKKVPLVVEVRDLWPESAIDLGVLSAPFLVRGARVFEKLLYRQAILVTVVTPGLYRALIERNRVSREKLIVIPNAADLQLVDESLASFDREAFRRTHGFHGFFCVLYVGAHGIANGLSQLTEVAKSFEGTDVLFVLIGDGMEKIRLLESVQKLGLNNIRFLDAVPQKEIFRFIQASDMGVSILKPCETFKTVYSNKTFDYLACKKPVLMCIDGVSRELIEEAGAGLYVNPGQPDELVKAVRAYQKDPERVLVEGLNGYAFVRKHFDREGLAQQFIQKIEERLDLKTDK